MQHQDIVPDSNDLAQPRLSAGAAGHRGNNGKSGTRDRISPAYSRSKRAETFIPSLIENKCVCISPEAAELDAYKSLRTQILQKTRGPGHNTIMVTSVGAGEGKTLTAINLALTMARDYSHTVLLVDCDLKKQDVHKMLGYQSSLGLADNLLKDTALPDLIVWPGIEKLTVISGGPAIAESTELLGSPRMKDLIVEIKGRYPERYIIFDVPAIRDSPDAVAFAPLVDGIVVVVQSGVTSESEMKTALQMLPKEKLLGLVINRKKGNTARHTS
jgi:non-specific protein-tyrosine kinase